MSTGKMPLDTSAYLADTGHLKTIEHGAYLLILMAMWRSREGWIPGDDNYLARATRMTLGRWKRIAPTIRALLTAGPQGVTQKRTQKDLRAELRDKNESPGGNPNAKAKSLKSNGAESKVAPPAESALTPFLVSSSESDSKNKEGSKRRKGETLPDGWTPGDAERLYGRTVLHLSDGKIDAAAEKMRRWAISNAHRAVARKSNWDLTFRNWLDGDAGRNGGGAPNTPRPAARGNGFAAAWLDLTANPEEDER